MIHLTITCKDELKALTLHRLANESVDKSYGAESGVSASSPVFVAPDDDDTVPTWTIEMYGTASEVADLLEEWDQEVNPTKPAWDRLRDRYDDVTDIKLLLWSAHTGLDRYEVYGDVKHPGLVKAERKISRALEALHALLKNVLRTTRTAS